MRTAVASEPEVWDEHRTVKLLRALRASLRYCTWRHADLSLEQLLALARDDSMREQENPNAPAESARKFAERAREFEIQILERAAKIDADIAESFRKNCDAHFFARDGSAAAQGEPLAKLPHPIEFDEPAALTN